ncbi:hypothetical protein ACI2KD_01760 [Pseudomonas monteilii]|jgi:hypothetical protein
MSNSPTSTNSFAVGHIDYAKAGYAYGWAFNQSRPEVKVSVEIMVQDKVVAYGIADQYRNDLDTLNIGDGYHGFCLKLSNELLDGQPYKLYARETTTGMQLLGGPIEFGPEKQPQHISIITRKSGKNALIQLLEKSPTITEDKKIAFIKVYEIGALAQETGRYEDATYAWSSLNHTLGLNALCQCKLAEIRLAKKDSQQALGLYKNAAEINYSFHWAHLGIMFIQESVGNYNDALEALRIATALNPECDSDGKMLNRLEEKQLSRNVDTLIIDKKNHEAITLILEALKTNPNNLTAQSLLNALVPSQELKPAYQYGRLELDRFKERLNTFDNFLEKIEHFDKEA